MEVRDPVHGSIPIEDQEIPLLENQFFQRLRRIKQLGFSEYVFPGATHTRYLHSIGVMHVSSLVFNSLFKENLFNSEYIRLKETLRLGCLLHDIGHAPLSHATESVMPTLGELKLPDFFVMNQPRRQASHEDYTIKTIMDSSLTDDFKLISAKFGVTPQAVSEIITGKCKDPGYYTIKGINYFPFLHQLVSSEMDCDRMDYLLRDSYFCGVSYGKFDLDWTIDNLKAPVEDGKAYLGISERAISTFDDFLLSRFHMFMMVYFHYRAVCLEQMLMRYVNSAPGEYLIPASIEEYLEHDDPYLLKVLRQSENLWAKKIVNNEIPQKIFETFGDEGLSELKALEGFLEDNEIDFIKCSSQGRLSKYYADDIQHTQYPMKVVRESLLEQKDISVRPIQDATNLFNRYSSTHAVNRIHLDFDDLSKEHQNKIKEICHLS